VIAGVMTRFYAVPKLAVAPIDQYSVTSLEAKGATIFDSAKLAEITTDLSIKARTVGDVVSSEKAPANAVVWVSTNTTRSSDGVTRSQSVERAAFNKVSGEAVNCCDTFDESTKGERVPTSPKGLVFKFPFWTEKKTYSMWDSTAQRTVAAKYTGTTKVQGMNVYKFVSDLPDTVTGTLDVPASVLGMTGTENVAAENHYQNLTTYLVEPTTGGIVDQSMVQKQWLANGDNQLVTTAATIAFTKAQVTDMVHQVKTKSILLRAAHGIGFYLLVIIGLLLAGAGVVLGRRRSNPGTVAVS
jgi:hypothetical protein